MSVEPIRSPAEERFRMAVIGYYRDSVRDAMLARIVMFSADPVFEQLCAAMADDLEVPKAEASNLLWPTSRALYKAAESTSDIPKSTKTTSADGKSHTVCEFESERAHG